VKREIIEAYLKKVSLSAEGSFFNVEKAECFTQDLIHGKPNETASSLSSYRRSVHHESSTFSFRGIVTLESIR
jgi:hypothetical protein